ncbi:hypothetical protein M3Y97_00279100 [Aphelenchoides bicaudatus]|nr:hypothetical protein M3Y97_00279100 [Aphelenchoides bicaudatus]
MNEETPDWSEALSLADFDTLVDEHIYNGEYKTAQFWAEKRLALFANRPLNQRLLEIAKYLNVLTIAGNWQMILSYCSHHELHLKHTVFIYFYANAMYNVGDYCGPVTLPINIPGNKVLTHIIDDPMEGNSATEVSANLDTNEQLDAMMKSRKIESRLMLVMAKSYLMVQNRTSAKACIKECLTGNPYSSEALQTAIDAKLLNDRDIKKLLATKTKKTSGTKVMNLLCELRCSKNEPTDNVVCKALENDVSIQAATAHRLYNRGNISEAYSITSAILAEYGYYEGCILVHIACLVALRKHTALFALTHRLVDTMKESHITWYAVGCYYYTIEQFAVAKKFLEKSTTINSSFGEGWVAYGHILYYSEEHEQAMNCFLRASRVLEGNFEPLLYIAVEYSFANNYNLASNFIKDAETAEPSNPIVSHEQAVISYMQQDFSTAVDSCRKAIRYVCKATPRENFLTTLSRPCSDFWEPMFEIMGLSLMRLSRFEEALEVFRKQLALGRNKASAWSNLGVCLGALGQMNEAIEALNESILMRPNDELIERAMEILINTVTGEIPAVVEENAPKTVARQVLVESSENIEPENAEPENTEPENVDCSKSVKANVEHPSKKHRSTIMSRTPVVFREIS